MGIGLRAPLDPGEGVIQLLCQRAGLEVVDGICLAFVGQFTDGADDGGGADAHGLLQRSIGGGLKQLVDGDEPFLYGHTPILKQLEAGAAGDAGEDGIGTGKGT